MDLAAAGVEVADHFAHVVLGSAYLDCHDRLKEHGVRLADGLLQDHGAGDLERHLGGVDVVVCPVEQRGLDADERVAGQDAELHGGLDALVDAGDVLPRDTSTGDLVPVSYTPLTMPTNREV